jgi:hypothetical protein
MATTAQETDQITRAVDLYIEGVRDGDAAKLREAFHPDAHMWGSMAGQRYDEPVAELIAMVDGKPGTSMAASTRKSPPSSRPTTPHR